MTLGGGFSFRRNFIKGLQYFPEVKYTESIQEADVCLITGTSMVTKETIQEIKSLGKKLIVRIDNVPRNSRNRNTGTSRLKSFSEAADTVIWQSQWAKSYLKDFLPDGPIIYNGVDTEVFSKNGVKTDFKGKPVYLYSRYNRDETKNWEKAWYYYQLIQRDNPDAKLVIVGKFSPEQIEYNFDFFRGEKFEFLGIQDDPEMMARIYRGCDYLMAVYFNDAFSNTYMEAMACGVQLSHIDNSGGTPEMMKVGVRDLKTMVGEYLEAMA